MTMRQSEAYRVALDPVFDRLECGEVDEQRMLSDAVGGVLSRGGDDTALWRELAALGVVDLAWSLTADPLMRRCVGVEVGRSGRSLPWAATAVAGDSLAKSGCADRGALLAGLATGSLTSELSKDRVVVRGGSVERELFTVAYAETVLAGSIALVHEAAGAMQRLVDLTNTYVALRTQFGRPLAALQAVQHRLADMALAAGQAMAMSLAVALTEKPATVHAARLKCAIAGRIVWQNAVQLHGAIGVTAESPICPFVMRLLSIERSLGTARWHAGKYALAITVPAPGGLLGAGDAAWREEVRAFLDEALTPDLRAAARQTVGFFSDPDAGRRWHARLYECGWAAPGWAIDCGGCAWTPEQRYIFELEARRADAPHANPMGLRMVGPVVMKFGAPAQQERFLPMILAGQQLWCQGFSEPNSGSDLTSLATRATGDGDEYVINGSKIWTTHGQHADWMFGLFRTGSGPRKQDGISFLLLDMRSPGITVRPIDGLDGEQDLNQVFFDDVRVPAGQRIGVEGGGWAVAKSLLELERGGGLAGPELRVRHERIGCPDDPVLRSRWTEIGADVTALEAMELAMLADFDLGHVAALPSMLKLQAAATRQALSQLAIDCHDGDGAELDYKTRVMLADRAHSIFGGATEIQKGIVARAITGSR